MASTTHKSAVRKVHSPLLIIANWTRSALTYTFALYVWITAPTFGAGPKACNEATRLIFFGASLPALGAGRILNLTGWGLLSALFLWRTLKGSATIIIAFSALFSSNAAQALLKPKSPVVDEVYVEAVEKHNFRTGEISRRLVDLLILSPLHGFFLLIQLKFANLSSHANFSRGVKRDDKSDLGMGTILRRQMV